MKERMRLTVAVSGHVVIEYTDGITGERYCRRFSAPWSPGYVSEHLAGRTVQVCEQLASTGTTLRASRETLPAVIRREYRRLRAAEAHYRKE